MDRAMLWPDTRRPEGEDPMRTLTVQSCLLLATLAVVAGCGGKRTAGLNRDAAADPSITGGHPEGESASSATAGAAGGVFGSGGVKSTDTLVSGGGTGTTGGDTGGTSGLGGVTQAGVSGSGTVDSTHNDGGSDSADADHADADNRVRYLACLESKDEVTCSQRGGSWRMKLASLSSWNCVCPTGEGGRPCTASSDCLSACSAWMDPMEGNGAWCQKNVSSYTCAAEGGNQVCFCRPETPFAVCSQ